MVGIPSYLDDPVVLHGNEEPAHGEALAAVTVMHRANAHG
jgi:hypothetical protein